MRGLWARLVIPLEITRGHEPFLGVIGASRVSRLAEYLPSLLFVAGCGQIALIVGSLTIPRVRGWREDTAKLGTLTRQVFWTYAVSCCMECWCWSSVVESRSVGR